MPDDRENMARISNTAVDLVAEMASRVSSAVMATCGNRSDIVHYIVGTALVGVGVQIMRRYPKPGTDAKDSEAEALGIVRGIYVGHDPKVSG